MVEFTVKRYFTMSSIMYRVLGNGVENLEQPQIDMSLFYEGALQIMKLL